MKTNEIKETRAAKVAEMRTINDGAMNQNRDLKPEEKTRFDGLETEVRALDTQLERAEKLAAFERIQAADEPTNEQRQLTEGFSVAKAMRETLDGRLTGREAEYAQERARTGEVRSGNGMHVAIPTEAVLGSENRALTTTTPGAGPGSNIVATNLAAMTDRRRATLMIERLGAVVLRNLTGNLDLPRLSQSGSASWVAEHAAATRTDAQFSKKSMGPKTVTAEYELSRRMMLQSNEAIETILRADLAYLLSQAMDAAAIRGGGTNEPTGILVDTDVQEVTGGAFSSDITADLIAALETDDVTGTSAFLTNPAVMNAARKTKDADGRIIPVSELFHGERVESSTQVPGNIGDSDDKNALIYGEWASLYLGYWSGIDLLVNPYAESVASKGGVLMHAFLDVDVSVRHPEGFRYAEID